MHMVCGTRCLIDTDTQGCQVIESGAVTISRHVRVAALEAHEQGTVAASRNIVGQEGHPSVPHMQEAGVAQRQPDHCTLRRAKGLTYGLVNPSLYTRHVLIARDRSQAQLRALVTKAVDAARQACGSALHSSLGKKDSGEEEEGEHFHGFGGKRIEDTWRETHRGRGS